MTLAMNTADKTALTTYFLRVDHSLVTMMLFQVTTRPCPSMAVSQILAPAITPMSRDRLLVAVADNKSLQDKALQTQSQILRSGAVLCLQNKTHQKDLPTMRCFWVVVTINPLRDPDQKHQIKAPLASTQLKVRRVILVLVGIVRILTEACSCPATIIRARDLD